MINDLEIKLRNINKSLTNAVQRHEQLKFQLRQVLQALDETEVAIAANETVIVSLSQEQLQLQSELSQELTSTGQKKVA